MVWGTQLQIQAAGLASKFHQFQYNRAFVGCAGWTSAIKRGPHLGNPHYESDLLWQHNGGHTISGGFNAVDDEHVCI